MRNPTPQETYRQTRALGAALQMRCGLDPIDPNASDSERREQARHCEMAEPFLDEPLHEIARQCLRIEDCPAPVSRLDMVRTAFSTATLSNVLTASVNATLAESFVAATDSTLGWTAETDRRDFSNAPTVVVGSAPKLALLPRGDRAEHASTEGLSEGYRIARYARRFAITDEDMVDDNLNALIAMPRRLGEAAAELRPDLVYSILLANAALDGDSVALFDSATHVNTDATASQLSEGNLERGIGRIAVQKESGRDLNLRTTHLIVPATKKISAGKILHDSQLDSEEQIILRSDARLDNGVTDPRDDTKHTANGKQWYLTAGNRRTIEVAFLAGTNRRPVIREYILSQGRWGIGFQISHDIGAEILDFRALYRGDGTA